jgi:hypothetical protein
MKKEEEKGRERERGRRRKIVENLQKKLGDAGLGVKNASTLGAE